MRAQAVALLLLAGAVACGPGRVVRHGEVNDDLLARIRTGLTAARALAFLRPVPARLLDQAALASVLAREIDLSYGPGDLERLSAIYARLGLLPPGAALRPALMRLYEGQVAALYDPRTKTLALVASALAPEGGLGLRLFELLTGRDVVGELLVAHELTHALQDQHWGIPTEPEPLTDSHGDRLLARRALLEGDATLASFGYVERGPLDAGTLARIEEELHGMRGELQARYPDVPEVVRASLALQYDEGTTFAGWALAAGGWSAVDRAEADPPESTEQVLHPARYFGLRDHPVTIALGGTEALEASGWKRVYEDTLGELDVRTLAFGRLPGAVAARVADGWGGDRLRALARGDDLVLVWMTAWDSLADAGEFADAMPHVLPDARIERRQDRVLMLLGPAGGPDLPRLAARVWRESVVRRPGQR
ncbi:MAG TPA: hypothetical protein VKW76_10450 [Candidatus Binatia bacterium]|nr:hypothetical protein [Candidatus Binatia bacterium]